MGCRSARNGASSQRYRTLNASKTAAIAPIMGNTYKYELNRQQDCNVDTARRAFSRTAPPLRGYEREIGKSFHGFAAIREDGALMGPWNPGSRAAQRQAHWDLTKALSQQSKLPDPARHVATGDRRAFPGGVGNLCPCRDRRARQAPGCETSPHHRWPAPG